MSLFTITSLTCHYPYHHYHDYVPLSRIHAINKTAQRSEGPFTLIVFIMFYRVSHAEASGS